MTRYGEVTPKEAGVELLLNSPPLATIPFFVYADADLRRKHSSKYMHIDSLAPDGNAIWSSQ